MDSILAITLRSLHQDAARLEQVGMNLANALTTGYKRSVVATAPTFAQRVDQAAAQAEPRAPMNQRILRDVRPGSLKSTSQPLDLALTGDGFFELHTPNGLAYTRQGEFRLDASGRLVSAQGHPLMGLGGEIDLAGIVARIDATGRIFDAAATTDEPARAQLKVVVFEADAQMQPLGDGLFATSGQAQPADMAQTQLRQGFLESSNVSSMHEMVQLIQTMRHFEAMQKVATGYDEMIGSAIRRLGELG